MSAGFTERSFEETILKGIELIRRQGGGVRNFIHQLFGPTTYNKNGSMFLGDRVGFITQTAHISAVHPRFLISFSGL
jgi:hypothetical protein